MGSYRVLVDPKLYGSIPFEVDAASEDEAEEAALIKFDEMSEDELYDWVTKHLRTAFDFDFTSVEPIEVEEI